MYDAEASVWSRWLDTPLLSGEGLYSAYPAGPASDLVDRIPTGSGITNRNMKVGFDAENRPTVAYLKYDADGNTQLYNARLESGAWVSTKPRHGTIAGRSAAWARWS